MNATASPASTIDRVRSRLRHEAHEYGDDHGAGLTGYSTAIAAYLTSVTAGGVAAHRFGRSVPTLGPFDVATLALASNRLSRILSRDPVTSPLRAPFTRFNGTMTGPAQRQEHARGEGGRAVVGELLTCPFCLAQWIGTVLAVGLVFAPAPTRFAIRIMASLAVADFVQFGWAKADQLTR